MADPIWTDPKVWEETNNVNSVLLNQYMSENMRYLLNRPHDILTLRDVGTFTTNSSTFVAVSTSSLRLALTVQQVTNVTITLNSTFSVNSASGRTVYMDVLQDGTTYCSSGTGTPLTDGMTARNNSNINGGKFGVGFSFVVHDLAAGDHFFDLYWRISASTATLYTDPQLQFRATA